VFVKAECGRPRIVGRVVDQSGPDGVVQHVGDCVEQLLLRVDHPGREASAEEVAGALVPVVEPPRVLPVQVLDSRRKPRLRSVEDQMDVIVHQAEGVAVPGVALDGLAEEAEIGDPVVIVTKDRGAVDAARGHVEVAVGKPGSKDAGHRLRAYEATAAATGDRARSARFRHGFNVLRGQ